MKQVVRQLDHIFASVADPLGPFEALAGLGFPIAWPVQETKAFTSGGLFLSNLKIEFAFFEGDLYHADSPPLCFTGLAFEPIPLARAVALLDERGLPHTDPIPLGFFTNCFIKDQSPSFYVFLCEYDLENYPWKDPLDRYDEGSPLIKSVGERWSYYRNLIDAGAGGPLGLTSAKELIVGASDFTSALHRWDALLAPARRDASGAWLLPPGPSIRLEEHPTDQVLGLKIEVQSLNSAKDFLEEQGCLGEVNGSEVRIDPKAVWGLDLRLILSA